jgi:hypothetical protein
MLNRIIHWASLTFVVSTIALLAWTRVEAISDASNPTWPELLLLCITVGTLPFALAKVVREGDFKTRRNWALLIGLCVVLVGLVFVLTK